MVIITIRWGICRTVGSAVVVRKPTRLRRDAALKYGANTTKSFQD
jgi:hypothetical protein